MLVINAMQVRFVCVVELLCCWQMKDVCSHSVMIHCMCVCVCVCVAGSLAVPSAAHGGILLICWSNCCQNTPGTVTLEGQERRRQCVLYSVVHGTSAGWHPLITAAPLIWRPAASLHTDIKSLQRAHLVFRCCSLQVTFSVWLSALLSPPVCDSDWSQAKFTQKSEWVLPLTTTPHQSKCTVHVVVLL